jgi:hypothetical protein
MNSLVSISLFVDYGMECSTLENILSHIFDAKESFNLFHYYNFNHRLLTF